MNIQVAVLCDAATDDNGKLNLLGAFDTIYTQQLPAVHPQCSCTHASLNELQRMLPRMENKARVVVLLLGKSGNRYEDAVTQMHLESLRDPSGSEARRFGLITSGEVAVYSAGGDLLYTGGITGARAHEGDNSGEDAAIAAIAGERIAQKQAPVFGCELNSGAQK